MGLICASSDPSLASLYDVLEFFTAHGGGRTQIMQQIDGRGSAINHPLPHYWLNDSQVGEMALIRPTEWTH